MAEDVSTLVVNVRANGADTANRQLLDIASSAGKADTASRGLTTGGLAKLAIGLGAVVLAAKKVSNAIAGAMQQQKEYDSLLVRMGTVARDAQQAKQALDLLRETQLSAAFGTGELTNAFIKLVNSGLEPSQRALTAYANIAIATGSDIGSVVDAVARGASGMTRQLQQMGVVAQQEGRMLRLTFGDVTEVVENSRAGIEKFMIQLGEGRFANAFQNRMDTLDGSLKKLGSAWGALKLEMMATAGAGEFVKGIVDALTREVNKFREILKSPEGAAAIEMLKLSFKNFGEVASSAMQAVSFILGGLFDETDSLAGHIIQTLSDISYQINKSIAGWKILSAWVTKTGSDIGANAVASASLKGTIEAFDDVKLPNFTAAIDKFIEAKNSFFTSDKTAVDEFRNNVFKALDDIHNKRITLSQDEEDFLKSSLEVLQRRDKAQYDALVKQTSATDNLLAIEEIRGRQAQARTERLQREQETLAKIKQLEIDRAKAAGGDPEAAARVAEAERKAMEDAMRAREDFLRSFQRTSAALNQSEVQELARIKDQYKTRESVAVEHFNRLKEIIARGTVGKEQIELLRRNNEEYTNALREIYLERQNTISDLQNSLVDAASEGRVADANRLRSQLEQEMREYKAFYENRKELFKDNQAMIEQIEKDHTARRKQRERELAKFVISSGSEIADSLVSITEDMAGRQSGAYKAMFVISKAFAIADSTVKVANAIAGAAASGATWQEKLAAMAAIAAATANIVSTIRDTKMEFSGSKARGGFIPEGTWGIVGDAGPEMVAGPAAVTSTRATASMLQGSTAAPTTINIYNSVSNEVETEVQETQSMDGKTVEIIIKRVTDKLTGDINTGGNAFSKSIEQSFNLKRGLRRS